MVVKKKGKRKKESKKVQYVQYAIYFLPLLFVGALLFIHYQPLSFTVNETVVLESPSESLRVLQSVSERDVSLIPSDSYTWNTKWSFVSTAPKGWSGTSSEKSAECLVNPQYALSGTADKYEDEFHFFVRFKPTNSKDTFQQILGHYNWELLQNSQTVQLLFGKLDGPSGEILFLNKDIDQSFFDVEHTADIFYKPKEYVTFYVDDVYVDSVLLNGSTLWGRYGKFDLSIGQAKYGTAKPFKGCVYDVWYSKNAAIQ